MNGIFYVAVGDEWIRETIISARSLKEHMPDIHVALYTDGDVQEAAFDIIERIQLPPGDQRIETLHRRIEIMAEVPYERALRLDTDMFAMADLSPVFDLLDRFDIASGHASTRVGLPQPSSDVPDTFPQYHAGLVAFKRSGKVTRFINTWASKFREYVAWAERQEELPPRIHPYHADNGSLRWTLYHSDLRIATLTPEWCCCAYCGFAQREVKLVHARGKRLERARRSLNEHLGPRVYIEGEIVGRP